MICVVTTTSGGHDSWNWAKVTKPNVNKTCPVFHYTRDNQHISATYKSPSFLRNHRHVKSQVLMCTFCFFLLQENKKKTKVHNLFPYLRKQVLILWRYSFIYNNISDKLPARHRMKN